MEKLNAHIEFLEMTEDDPQLLVWLLELRRHRENNWQQRAEAAEVKLAELVPDSDVQASIDKLKNGYFRRWIKEYSSKEAKSGYVAGSINVRDIVNVFNYADACAASLRNIEEAK